MATSGRGQAPFRSAWAYRPDRASGRMRLLCNPDQDIRNPFSNNYPWMNWLLPDAVNLVTNHYRFGKEELAENTHTWHGLEDANITIEPGITFLLRFNEQETGGTAIANVDSQFQYNKNGAGWNNITTTSSVVKAVASVAFTNGQDCTQRLSGSGTFETSAAGCTEDGLSGGTANDIAASGCSETECALQIVAGDVADGDTITFQLTSPGTTITNNVVPTVTVDKNIVLDGALEHWDSATNLQGWLEAVGGSSTVTKETTLMHGGAACAKLTGDADNALTNIYQTTITLVPATAYTLTFWYYMSAADKTMSFYFYDNSLGHFLALDGTWATSDPGPNIIPNATTYTQVSINFTTPADHTAYTFDFYRDGLTSASCWIDDIQIALYAAPSTWIPKVIFI